MTFIANMPSTRVQYDTVDDAVEAVRAALLRGDSYGILVEDDRGGNGGVYVEVTSPINEEK